MLFVRHYGHSDFAVTVLVAQASLVSRILFSTDESWRFLFTAAFGTRITAGKASVSQRAIGDIGCRSSNPTEDAMVGSGDSCAVRDGKY